MTIKDWTYNRAKAARNEMQKRSMGLPPITNVFMFHGKNFPHNCQEKFDNCSRMGDGYGGKAMEREQREERRSDAGAMLHSSQFWRQVTEQSWDVVCVLDASGRMLYITNDAERWLGAVPASWAELVELFHDSCSKELQDMRAASWGGGAPHLKELRLNDRDHHEEWLETRWIWTGSQAHGDSITLVMRNISDRKRKEAELERMAYHDPLTGLPNRRFFMDHYVRSLAYAKRNGIRMAVICLDVDLFKGINDTLGHDVGDEFLRHLAARLAASLRETDLLARMSGDEFIVLLPDVDSAEGAEEVMRRLFMELRKAWVIGGRVIQPTISAGAAMYPHHSEDGAELLKYADQALYQVKRAGGNGYRFYREGK
jgi:diguanylate cyclase (GGDEF)-like protein